MMSETCGENASEGFASYDPTTQCLRTSQGCLLLSSEDSSTEFCRTWPQAGTMRNGTCFARKITAYPNHAQDFFLSPIPHDQVHRRYFLTMPSMLNAIVRGYMSRVQDRPTLTTKIVDRAPCPYWETPLGPRYLTESEAEMMTGYPVGWTLLATRPLATPSRRSALSVAPSLVSSPSKPNGDKV